MLEKILESPLDWKEFQPVHPKGNQSWIFIGRTDAEAETSVLWPVWPAETSVLWWEELTHLKRPWCWERLKAGREGDDRGWDGWMASLSQWTWVWVNSGSWWWTQRPGVPQPMGSQRVRHNWTTELKWTGTVWSSGFPYFPQFNIKWTLLYTEVINSYCIRGSLLFLTSAPCKIFFCRNRGI